MNIPKTNYRIHYGENFCHNKSFVYSQKLYDFLMEMFDDEEVATDVKYWCDNTCVKQTYKDTKYGFRVEIL